MEDEEISWEAHGINIIKLNEHDTVIEVNIPKLVQ